MLVPLLSIGALLMIPLLLAQPAAASCLPGAGVTVDVSQLPAVDGYTPEQVGNAAAIMNAAASLGMSAQAQTVGVMTALGESGLSVLAYGDEAGPDSRGLFQQRDSWGSLAQRMDPTASSILFFARLQTVAGWEKMTPSAAAHAVQVNADPDHYTRYFEPATTIVAALSGGAAPGGGCSVSADAVTLAQQIMTAHAEGRFKTLVGPNQPDHLPEIQAIANGQSVPDCGIDVGILQAMVVALNNFSAVGVSDINRKCTGQSLGAGPNSSHNLDGGGHAVDFYALNGASITGADADSIKLIGLLDALMPKGSRIGQADCRAAAGTTVTPANFSQINDSCNHLHVDNAFAK
ncbi:hypothetical protein ACL9RL_18430 [Plantibacter sp. Mn2098]|uniref:hypothetical protein n=1 Tax=Plantibacter sp. Mn2098 TaxID=3395266 RepID=UPI003BEAB184